MKREPAKLHASSTGHHLASPEWTDLHFLAMQPEYEEMLRWVGFQCGWHVLDAGSGSGAFIPLMTELVGSEGVVSAVDLAPENVRAVEERVRLSELPAPVRARVGSILDLPYDDDTFDAVWCANTSQYLGDDELRSMLAEFCRVTRPGGLVAIKDYDVTAQQVQPSTPTLFIHLIESLCRNDHGSEYHRNLMRTIELTKWLREAGLIDLKQKPTLMVRTQPIDDLTKGIITTLLQSCSNHAQQVELPEEETRLWQELGDTDSANHIFHHPDFQYRGIQTVFCGRVPK